MQSFFQNFTNPEADFVTSRPDILIQRRKMRQQRGSSPSKNSPKVHGSSSEQLKQPLSRTNRTIQQVSKNVNYNTVSQRQFVTIEQPVLQSVQSMKQFSSVSTQRGDSKIGQPVNIQKLISDYKTSVALKYHHNVEPTRKSKKNSKQKKNDLPLIAKITPNKSSHRNIALTNHDSYFPQSLTASQTPSQKIIADMYSGAVQRTLATSNSRLTSQRNSMLSLRTSAD